MKEEILELFRLASKFFFKKFKETGGSQAQLAREFGVTQSYLSSVMNGSRSASFELYNQIAEKLYGPLDKFITVGRRISEGKDPLKEEKGDEEGSVEELIAKLTYYVMDYKRLQKELSRQKKFYETIIENLQSGVVVMDKDNRVVYANRFLEKMTGMPADKFIGSTPFASEDKEFSSGLTSIAMEYRKAANLLTPVFYERIPTTLPSGKIIYHSGWIIPLFKDKQFDGMICTLRDSTLAQNLSDLLTQSVDQCPYGIGIVQQEASGDVPTAYFVNRHFLEIFSLTELNPKPETIPFLELHQILKKTIKNGEEWDKLERKAFEEGLPEVNCLLKLKNGKEYEWRSTPLVNENNRHLGRFATVNEVEAKASHEKQISRPIHPPAGLSWERIPNEPARSGSPR